MNAKLLAHRERERERESATSSLVLRVRECDIVVGFESERVRLALRERKGWEWV